MGKNIKQSKEVRDSQRTAIIFFICAHTFVILIFLLYKNVLREKLFGEEFAYVLSFFGLMALEWVLFFVAGKPD